MLGPKSVSVVAFCFWMACVAGCSDGERDSFSTSSPTNANRAAVAAVSARNTSAAETTTNGFVAPKSPPSESHKRKLVYSGDVRIEVKDFQELEKELPGKVESLGGFVGSYTESRRDQKERSGTWIVRVPVDQFSILLDWLDTNFYVVEKSVKSKDVTEEFVDLQSRLSNKRKTEVRLTEHLAKSTSKLTEILEMEKEIERVREDIERIEGRLSLLRDQSELSTLTIRAESRAAFVAAQSPSTFSGIGTVFYNSCWAIGQMMYGLIVLLVATLPFGILVSSIAYLIYLVSGQSPMRIFKRWRQQ
jgi:hypothetical protein